MKICKRIKKWILKEFFRWPFEYNYDDYDEEADYEAIMKHIEEKNR